MLMMTKSKIDWNENFYINWFDRWYLRLVTKMVEIRIYDEMTSRVEWSNLLPKLNTSADILKKVN